MLPDALAEFKAIEAGEHDVQDGQIRGRLSNGGVARRAVFGDTDSKAFPLQVELHHLSGR